MLRRRSASRQAVGPNITLRVVVDPVPPGNDEQERRLDDVDTGDDEGDDEQQRMADEPAGRRGDRRDREEREANAADHRGHVALRTVAGPAAGEGREGAAEEPQSDDHGDADERRPDDDRR